MRRLLFFLLFLSGLVAGVWIYHGTRYRDVFRAVCDLAEDIFYKQDIMFARWVQRCRHQAAHIPMRMKSDQLLLTIQDQMNEMEVSHFSIYDPAEDRRLWLGESIDTGIRSRFVEDSLIVYKVIPGSAA